MEPCLFLESYLMMHVLGENYYFLFKDRRLWHNQTKLGLNFILLPCIYFELDVLLVMAEDNYTQVLSGIIQSGLS